MFEYHTNIYIASISENIKQEERKRYNEQIFAQTSFRIIKEIITNQPLSDYIKHDHLAKLC